MQPHAHTILGVWRSDKPRPRVCVVLYAKAPSIMFEELEWQKFLPLSVGEVCGGGSWPPHSGTTSREDAFSKVVDRCVTWSVGAL